MNLSSVRDTQLARSHMEFVPEAPVRKTVAVSNSPRAGLAVAGLSLGTSLNPLNSSMIAVALVVLREDFRLDVATVTWVITAFYITSAAGQPLMGQAG